MPSGPLSLLGTCGELVAVGQVALVAGHGGQQTAQTGGTGRPIGRRPLGPLVGNGTRVCGGNVVAGAEQVVGGASGSASKSAVNALFDYCSKYCP